MPWSIQRKDGRYCVIKDADGKSAGCHDSRADAIKQQRALYAQESRTASVLGEAPTEAEAGVEAVLTAALAPLKPPRAFFEREEPDSPTPPTFLASGEAFGHLALWETCHSGFQNGGFGECVKAPHSRTGYQMFHLGQIETAEGDMIAVGKLTYGTGHAPMSAGLQAASEHYDNTGQVGAFVRMRDGRYGPWFSGVIKSDLSPEGLRDLRANPLSGDWRALNHSLELVAALAVVVPGFPIPRAQLALSASAEVSTLILPGPDEDDLYEPRSRDFIRRRSTIASFLK